MTAGDVFSSFKCSGSIFLPELCPDTVLCLWVKHDFCNSLENRGSWIKEAGGDEMSQMEKRKVRERKKGREREGGMEGSL